MNKKITVATILLLVVVAFLSARNKEQEDMYLKAVAEKDLPTKMELLKQYVEKYGQQNDKYLMFIYLNLAETSYKLKNFDDVIRYGEVATGFQEIDPTNKLNMMFFLANSYYNLQKEMEKGLKYGDSIIEVSNDLIKKMEASEQDREKITQMVNNYKQYFIAPAYRLQSLILFAMGKDNDALILQAAEKAISAYDLDKSENSNKIVISLAGNLYQKNKFNEAISVIERIIDKENPKFEEANFLGSLYYKIGNRDKSIQFLDIAYKSKHMLDLAMKIGQLVQKKDPYKGINYFADAYVLSRYNKESQAFKFLEHLYFNIIAKDKSPEERETGFKDIIEAAKTRLGTSSTEPTTPPNTESSTATNSN